MKSSIRKLTFGAGALALAGWTALAAPLQRKDMPAEPAWVAHLDCDGLRPTAIGRYLLDQMNKPDAQEKLAGFESVFGFDLRTQVHGVSLFGTGTAPEDGVLMLYADFDPSRLATLAKAAKDSQSTDYKSHVIYNWIDERKTATNGVQPRLYAAIAGKRVIFAQREAPVARELDVLDGARPNLAASQAFAGLGADGSKQFIDAAARKLELPADNPGAALFRLAKLVRLQVGEAQGQAKATLMVEASDEEVAGHIASVAQGLLALVKLQKQKPETVKFAEALQLKQDGSRVLANLALPAADVVEMMKADAARKAASKDQKK